ncbi:putative major facilitator superfamily, sugar transporter (TC 2.A.1.1) family protein [Lyophyllum shimeji]|uniref:Major facilitator superfamily, sugar transporter (TC 2.A.1.1) family protein n=1 Tax=Lyophyllum shimeji TaxID=47721 RepID=A0A9P3PPJ2_LYOSH|nr:putative major facilitator superfamily, sugar transporter (TC 2.A.1.1) family protein [Lyophyllum shimeji]
MSRHLAEFSKHRNAYFLALSAAMGSIFYGWDIGLIGGVLALPSFQHYFGVNKMNASQRADLNGNIVSVLQAGCFFGALSTGYFSSRFGRKPSLLASGVIFLIGSLIQCIVGLGSSEKVGLRVLYFSRFLGGWGVGMVSALVPSYVSECTPRSIRGRCTGLIQFANNIGIMLSFWVNYSSSKDIEPGEMQWRIPFIVQMIPGFFFVLAMSLQPESPRWLVERGKVDEAAKALAFVGRTSVDDEDVVRTVEEIKADFAGKEDPPLLKQLLLMGESRTIALRCFIPSLVMFFQQWTGTNAINYFSPQIFAGLGISGTTSGLFATGIYGVVKVVAVGLVLLFAVESLGRKKCLIIGGLGQGAMMLWIGGYSGINKSGKVVPASYVSIIAVYLYAVFYCVGWGPLPWVVAGEVAPNHLRTAALSIAIGVNWLFSFTISKLTPIMLNNITYGTFLLFGFCCLIMTVWAYFFLPETKGYALEDIKYLFEKDMILRSLNDAPCGRLFVGSRRATPVLELRGKAEKAAVESPSLSALSDTKDV